MGEIAAILTTICWSVGIFPFTIAAQRLGTAALNQYRLLLAWFIITIILLFFFIHQPVDLFSSPKPFHYLFLGLSGIIGFTIGDYCSFSSFKILGPKLGSLYTTFAPGVALIAGYLVLDETINFAGIIGIAITLMGVIWLTLSKKDAEQSKKIGFVRTNKGVILGILGASCQGLGLVLSKLGMNYYPEHSLNTFHAVWIRLLFAFSSAFLVSSITGSIKANSIPVLKNHQNGLVYIFTGTLLGPVIGVSLSLYTIQQINVSVAQTIFALLPVFVLPINLLVYKEKINAHSVFACFLAITGVLILVWRHKF
jgi:drug/metabolite transporter (DMT)-like permease